jgi:DNA-binding transcriptional MerR regulator
MVEALRVVRTLRSQRMPLQEIRALLTTDDPEIVRRHLELHRERLEERLTAQVRSLASIERRWA